MSGTARLKCDCENVFQDARYGKYIRVMNKKTKDDGYRCTSCGKDRK